MVHVPSGRRETDGEQYQILLAWLHESIKEMQNVNRRLTEALTRMEGRMGSLEEKLEATGRAVDSRKRPCPFLVDHLATHAKATERWWSVAIRIIVPIVLSGGAFLLALWHRIVGPGGGH